MKDLVPFGLKRDVSTKQLTIRFIYKKESDLDTSILK
jgi:hypothetical protein